MFRLIYRLIIQRVQEYKAKRSAIKRSRSQNAVSSPGVAQRKWALIGFLILVSALLPYLYRWQDGLPLLESNRDRAHLQFSIDSIDTPPMVLYLEQWPPVLSEVPESDNVSRIVIQNSQFLPRFQIIPAGSTVEIINEDSILHNTHIDDGHNTVFNVATPLKSVIVRKTLTATGLLNVRCDLHPGMYGWAFVPPSPHFAIVREAKIIQWDNIVPGSYRLIVWQPEQISRHRTIELLPGKRYKLDYH